MNKERKKRLRREMIDRWDGRCSYCHRDTPRHLATLDHLLPESRNGQFEPMNLVVACYFCNQSKSNRTPAEWAADILAVRPIGMEDD